MDDWRDSTALTDFGVAEAFAIRLASVPPSRLADATGVTARCLHGLLAELRPTPAELRATVDFLTETGHYADARRQEWVLLADVLGVSAWVQDNDAGPATGGTVQTMTGPFYRADVQELPLGADICRDGKGDPLAVRGRVTDLGGKAVSGAVVEVWHANSEGRYENQEPDLQPEYNLRGRFRSDAQGRFHFRSVMPKGYALPSEGPVGRLMAGIGLCLDRPAHIHFRVTADGCRTLTTQVFDRADPAIGRDAIFGVKPGLLADFGALPGGKRGRALDLTLVLFPEEGP